MTKITHSQLQHPHTINLTNWCTKQRKTMLPLKIEHVPTQPNGDVFIMGLTFSGKLWLCMKWSEAEQHFSLTWRCSWVCCLVEKKNLNVFLTSTSVTDGCRDSRRLRLQTAIIPAPDDDSDRRAGSSSAAWTWSGSLARVNPWLEEKQWDILRFETSSQTFQHDKSPLWR